MVAGEGSIRKTQFWIKQIIIQHVLCAARVVVGTRRV